MTCSTPESRIGAQLSHSDTKHAFPLLPPRLYLVLHRDFSENSKNNESSSGNMNIYRNTEDKFLKHRCNICEKQILTKEKIKQHQDEVHKNKGLKCTECNHRVKSRSSLSQHIEVVHEGVRFLCRQCDHKATSNGN